MARRVAAQVNSRIRKKKLKQLAHRYGQLADVLEAWRPIGRDFAQMADEMRAAFERMKRDYAEPH